MDEIEKEYKEKNKLTDASDSRTDGMTTSADSLLVRNWQDILAIYVYEQSRKVPRNLNWILPARMSLLRFLQR